MFTEDDLKFKEEKFDSKTNEYEYTFECSDTMYKCLVKHFGTEDFEDLLSKEFSAYVMSLKEGLDD